MKTRKRSNAPILWGLFGAGGMMAALFGPIMVFITGIAVPLGGLLLPADTMSYPNMLAFAQNFIGKGFIFAAVFLFIWHAVHRIYHLLPEVGIAHGLIPKLLTYGVAVVVTVVSAVSLLCLGF
ncbi:MAG: fumarate reductase subunit FrdD [Candidatus Accumulibacter sp.]|jgi:fumarate reductase subunit D|nr:fumarate reductase subunit FrdD [Accumulibacter sp.]